MTLPFNFARKHLLVLTAGLSILILLLITATSVSAQEVREKYHVCVNEASGLVTFVDPSEECKSVEYRIILYDATEIDEIISSLSILETQMDEVDIILDGWWGDVGSLPIPIPKPAWFDQVSLDITLMTQDILDIWGTLPIPLP